MACYRLTRLWLVQALVAFSNLRFSQAFHGESLTWWHGRHHAALSGRRNIRVVKFPAVKILPLPAIRHASFAIPLAAAAGNDEENDSTEMTGVVELPGVADSLPPSEPVVSSASRSQPDSAAPFLSQRTELDPDALKLNLDDAKQTRVIIYIVLSLLPVLFLIPFMLGSRDLLPLIESADLPPVQM